MDINAEPTNLASRADFRILFCYPNIQQSALMPYSIGLFTALLKQHGFTSVDLFDSTFYLEDNNNFQHFQLALRTFDWAERGVQFKRASMMEDWIKKVEEYGPDLILTSVVEATYPLGRDMIRALPERFKKVPVLWGGVFPTFAPEIILKDNVGDYVCRGEGEAPLIEFCKRAVEGKTLWNIPNIWARKEDGMIIKNTMSSEKVNLDDLPPADYSLFEEQAIYRPMQGKIWRTVGIETQRGCPFTCTYCNSPSQNTLAKQEYGARYYRKKSWHKVAEEIKTQRERHGVELLYMLTDTFLAMSDEEFDEMVEIYQDLRIPFWMNTRAETMTAHRAEGLDKMNALRISFGIEHGNPQYRKEMLKRTLTNERMIQAFEFGAGRDFTTTGNCIIGMPEENRGLIFDTIEFCRQLPEFVEQTGAFTFAPFHGTPLREIAIQKGYLDPNVIVDIQDPKTSVLDQPQLRKEEVLDLARTFGLYQTLPKDDWKWVQIAEKDTPEGRKVFEELHKKFYAILDERKKKQKNYTPAPPKAAPACTTAV